MLGKVHQNVLVLGSSGLIGSALVRSLREKGINAKEYDLKNGLDQDLSNSKWNTYLQHALWQADFVYFLAFDVGGAKYLGNMEGDREKIFRFVHDNTQMMVNVFDCLALCKTPFIFTSSMMARMPWSIYGNLKQIGEIYTHSLGTGANVRLWNVYGPEKPGEKSHVITDFCHQAATTGKIKMLSHGREQRQFIHVVDAVGALEAIREDWDSVQLSSRPSDFDVSSGNWVKIRTIADKVAEEFGGSVKVVAGKHGDRVQKNSKQEPDLKYIQGYPFFWKPIVPLSVGIKWMAEEFKKQNA